MTSKSDIIDKAAAEAGVTKAQAAAVIDASLAAIGAALAGGDKVSLMGFGVFKVTERAARKGRNPATGATIDIAASKSVKFKPGKDLDAQIEAKI